MHTTDLLDFARNTLDVRLCTPTTTKTETTPRAIQGKKLQTEISSTETVLLRIDDVERHLQILSSCRERRDGPGTDHKDPVMAATQVRGLLRTINRARRKQEHKYSKRLRQLEARSARQFHHLQKQNKQLRILQECWVRRKR